MTLDISRIRGLCFDIDGTLRDTDNRLVEQISSWLHIFSFLLGKQDPTTVSRRFVMAIENPGNYLHSLADRLGIDSTIDAAENLVYRMGFFHNTEDYLVVPGTEQMLSQFRPHFSMAIVSARGELKTMAFLSKFDLVPYFSAIATSQTCPHTKPFPDPVLWAAKQMGLPPEACVMIGDTVFDIRAGKAAGAQTVGVLCGFGEETELHLAGADIILEKPSDLVNILLNSTLTDSLAE